MFLWTKLVKSVFPLPDANSSLQHLHIITSLLVTSMLNNHGGEEPQLFVFRLTARKFSIQAAIYMDMKILSTS
jgi:hypothetical protein